MCPGSIRLDELAAGIAGLTDGGATPITHLTADSRAARPGSLFAALPGTRTDGRAYIADAVARGAAAVLAREGTAWPEEVPARPLILHPEPRRALALLAAAHAGAQPRTVVAVTGTNGKTSTAEFLRQLFAASGVAAASLGTLGVVSPGWTEAGSLTTPDPVALAGALARLAREGVEAAAVEASSHGLDQFRLDGVRLAAAGFSNLSRDHLDYHGKMDAYRAAKLRLFDALLPEGAPAVACTTLDHTTMGALRGIAERRGLRLSLVGEGGDQVRLLRATPLPDGQALLLEAEGVTREIELRLPGRFQADNALLAAGHRPHVVVVAAGDELPSAKVLKAASDVVMTVQPGLARSATERLERLGVRPLRLETTATAEDAALVLADLGVMPWDVLHQGLARQLGWSLGTVIIVVGVVVLLGAPPSTRACR